MQLDLLRVGNDFALTQGVLRTEERAFAVTLELPWHANKPQQSCIPVGTYTCKRIKPPKFGETFEVTDVPGRSHILFHKGNQTGDTAGCILVGEQFVDDRIGESKAGFDEFLRVFKDCDEFTLVITEVP